MYLRMNAKEIRMIIGIIGNVLSLFISLSHMPKIIQIYKKKSVDEDFKQHGHIAMVAKCSLWILYGLPLVQKDGLLVSTSNGVGLVIELIYLVVFFIYRDKESQRKTGSLLGLAILFLFVFEVDTLLLAQSLSARRKIIGGVSIVYTIIMHVSIALNKMEDGENYQCGYIPVWFSLANFINAGVWIAYSVIYKIDIYVLVINVLGALACATHFMLECCATYSPCLLLPKRIDPTIS